MIETLLEEIYFSDCGPIDKMKNTEEYNRLTKEAGKYYDKLFAILNEEQSKWLDEIYVLSGGTESEWGLVCFRAGIKFGLRLINELFGKEIEKQKNTPPEKREG